MTDRARFLKLTVAEAELPAGKLADLGAACRRAGVELTSRVSEQSGGERADVLSGVVRAGQQRIPEEYLTYVEKCSPEASLLLFCEQALAQPFVSLSEGRVTLLSPEADEDIIYGRLRVLLAERGLGPRASVEKAGSAWWLGDSRRALASAAIAEELGSLTLAFSLTKASRASVDGERAESPMRKLDAQASLRAALSGKLTAETGLLHLAPSLNEWLVCWPARPNTLWLLSSLRLPLVSDLSFDHGGRGTTRLRAATGDIALAVSSGSDEERVALLVRKLVTRLVHGGPAVFDEVTRSVADQTNGWVSVVEVR